MCTAHPQICGHVKDPVSICRKRVGLACRWCGHRKILYGCSTIPPLEEHGRRNLQTLPFVYAVRFMSDVQSSAEEEMEASQSGMESAEVDAVSSAHDGNAVLVNNADSNGQLVVP